MRFVTYDKIKDYLGIEPNTKKSYTRNTSRTQGKKRAGYLNRIKRDTVLKFLLIGGAFCLIIVIVGMIGFAVMVYSYSKQLPPPGKPFAKDIAQNTNIYDRNGVLLGALYDSVDRQWISLSEIDSNMKWAMLGAEDINFYSEPGFDIFGIARAAFRDIFARSSANLQGGSTITQQLVKTTELSSDQTLQRKIKEIILTLEVEKQYSKDQILEAYLNQISFGGSTSGIRVAAEKYFGVEPSQLDLAQSAFLAALPQAPSYYSPIFQADPNNLIKAKDGKLLANDAVNARAEYVLDEMLKYSRLTSVTSDQVKAAKTEIINFEFNPDTPNYKAPAFVEYVKNLLIQKYGEQKVLTGGLQVYTTLDYNMQQAGEAEINNEYDDFNSTTAVNRFGTGGIAYRFNGDDGALLSIDPKNGEILAMVGSPHNKTEINILTDSTGIQPGSSIKPMLYMEAFKDLTGGVNAQTMMPDIPITIGNYKPVDFFQNTFKGVMSIDSALSVSLNVPAAETLYSLNAKDQSTFTNELQNLGYTKLSSWDPYAITNALGAINVILLDHVAAYSVLANQGTLYTPTAIMKVLDPNGSLLEQYNPQNAGRNVIDSAYPYMMDKMLEHYTYLIKYGIAQKLIKEGYDIAGKTGTNNTPNNGNASSLTFVGYTPDLVTGIWFGNQAKEGQALGLCEVGDAAQPYKSCSGGGNGALVSTRGQTPEAEFMIPYWGDYMDKVLKAFSQKSTFDASRPADIVNEKLCTDTGLLYDSTKTNCPVSDVTNAILQKDNLPKFDDEHFVVNVCPNNPNELATPDMVASGSAVSKTYLVLKTYDQNFQQSLNDYLSDPKNAAQVQNLGIAPNNTLPTAYCSAEQGISVGILSPANGANYSAGSNVNVHVSAITTDSQNPISSVNVYFNSNNVATLSGNGSNYTGSFTIPANTADGSYQLTAKVVDAAQNEKDASITINVGSGGGGQASNDVVVESPTDGQVIIPLKPTSLKLLVKNIPASSVTSAYFNVYSNNQQLNGSPIQATQNPNNPDEWTTMYQFPASTNGYAIVGFITVQGQGILQSQAVIVNS